MRGTSPGFLNVLQGQLESLSIEELERVNRPGGLEIRDLLDLILKPRDHTVHLPDEVSESDLVHCEDVSEETVRVGNAVLSEGTVGLVIVTDESHDRSDVSNFLDSTFRTSNGIKTVWLMSNPSRPLSIDGTRPLQHYETFGLTPINQLRLSDGSPDYHVCGSGDVVAALHHTGELDRFKAEGGKHVVVVERNLRPPDPRLIGLHVFAQRPVTCEIKQKTPASTGMLCEHAGIRQIVEGHRFSSQTDLETFHWAGTGTLVFDASLDFSSVVWPWHRVKRRNSSEMIVKYERYIHHLTAHFQTQFVISSEKPDCGDR